MQSDVQRGEVTGLCTITQPRVWPAQLRCSRCRSPRAFHSNGKHAGRPLPVSSSASFLIYSERFHWNVMVSDTTSSLLCSHNLGFTFLPKHLLQHFEIIHLLIWLLHQTVAVWEEGPWLFPPGQFSAWRKTHQKLFVALTWKSVLNMASNFREFIRMLSCS